MDNANWTTKIIEFVEGHGVFPGTIAKGGKWTAEDRFASMIRVLGPFPDGLLSKASKRDEFFGKEGNLLRIPILTPATLEHFMDGDEGLLLRPKDMPKTEVPIFADFLQGMLALDPEQRKTASELLDHDWLRA